MQYYGSPGLVPQTLNPPRVFAVDDDGDVFWGNTQIFTGNVSITVKSDAATDPSEKLTFGIEVPNSTVEDHTNMTFTMKVDATPPSAPVNVTCWADEPYDGRKWADTADDDGRIFVTWENASDGASGSGVAYHAAAFDLTTPTTALSIGDDVQVGIAGERTMYVRAVDRVGNWGEAASGSIIIDLRSVDFTALSPSGEEWHNVTTVKASATVVDLESMEGVGAGVIPSSIYYRVSHSGNDSSDFGDWVSAGAAGEPTGQVNASGSIGGLQEGELNYIQWRASDAAMSGHAMSEPLSIKVDLTGPSFTSHWPSSNQWIPSRDVNASVTISDKLSGVEVSDLVLELTQDGGEHWSMWTYSPVKHQDGDKKVTAESLLKLQDGDDNLLRWTVSDTAGNRAVSDEYAIMVDSEPVGISFLEPLKGDEQPEKKVTVRVKITDALSGVDPSTIAYRYKLAGSGGAGDKEVWSGWNSAGVTADTGSPSVTVDVDLTLERGQDNEVQFRAGDMAGSGLTTSNSLVIMVNEAPLAKISSPDDGDVYNETDTIEFDGSASQDTVGDIVSWSWVSSLGGNLSDLAEFAANLTVGEHVITLTVYDGFGMSSSQAVTIRVLPVNLTPAGDGGDGDDEGDGGDEGGDESGYFGGLDSTSIFLLLALIAIIVILLLVNMARSVKRGEEEMEEEIERREKRRMAKALARDKLALARMRYIKKGEQKRRKEERRKGKRGRKGKKGRKEKKEEEEEEEKREEMDEDREHDGPEDEKEGEGGEGPEDEEREEGALNEEEEGGPGGGKEEGDGSDTELDAVGGGEEEEWEWGDDEMGGERGGG
jgi:hypothetical protein